MQIGVLSFQGAVTEHLDMIRSLGIKAVPVKSSMELARVHGLVLPGGESTTHGKLLDRFGLLSEIRARVHSGMPVFGTCTGVILLARDIVGSQQHRLGTMDITVERNAFGRQVDSFETGIEISGITDSEVYGKGVFPAVFIRAPIIRSKGEGVETLAVWQGDMVMVRQGNMIGCAFHPELTDDARVHRYFVDIVQAHYDGKQVE